MSTTKPTIHLKNVEVHIGLSDETPAYTAKLFVDGKHFADISNQGHGGPDMVDAPKNRHGGFSDRLKALETLIAETYPKSDMSKYGDGTMEDMDESLEVLCHTLAWESVDRRNMKSRLSRTVMTFENGKVYSWKGKKTEDRMNAVAAKKPEAIILNRLAFDEAWSIIKKAA